MRIDVDVAFSAHVQIEAAVFAELSQHVVVEGDACFDVDGTASVELEFDQDVGLFGGALYPRASAHASTLP
jgi:hypothetical protein